MFRLHRWLRAINPVCPARMPRARSFKPFAEPLEDRQLLSTVSLQLTNIVGINSFAGVGFQENVVTNDLEVSVNGKPDLNKSDFQAKINWGDGGSSTGDLVNIGSDLQHAFYLIKGTHIYDQPGTNIPINVTVTGPDSASTSALTCYADVSPMPSGIPGIPPSPSTTSMSPANVQLKLSNIVGINATAGVGFQNNVVANGLQISVNGQPFLTTGDIHAQVNWGDSAYWTPANLVYTGSDAQWASYTVTGSYTYNQPGRNIPIVVYVNGPDGTSTSALTAYAQVAPNPNGMSLSSLNPSEWTQNKPGYNGTITVSGGSGSYRNLIVTGLPPGLSASLSGSTIMVTGTPTQAGTFTVDFSVQDSNGNFVSGTDPLIIDSPMSLGPLSPTAWIVNQPGYNGIIAITGGSGSYSGLQVTGLPAGLTDSLSGSTISIQGTPTQAGTFTLNVSVQDSYGTKASGTDTLTIASPLNLGPLSPTVWVVNKPVYNGTISITGGSGSYSGLQISGLPAGLADSLSGSTISIQGTPTKTGTFTLSVSVQDSSGSKASGTDKLTIESALSLGALTPAVWTVNKSGYKGVIKVTGGSGAYSNLQITGMPAGLTDSLSGSTISIQGTPTQTGTFTLNVSLEDSEGFQASGTYNLLITATALTLTPSTLPDGVAGQSYQQTISASGGSGNYTFSRTAGTLPTGLSLTSAGILSGTPTKEGTFSFTIKATDTAVSGLTGSQAYTVTVEAGAPDTITVSAPTQATLGTGFNVTITAKDKYGNGITGPISLTSSDGQPVTPATVSLSQGTATTTVTLNNLDTVNLIATDGGASGTSGTITLDSPPETPSSLQFQLEASVSANPSAQTSSIDLFQSIVSGATNYVNSQVGSYKATSQIINSAIQSAKNWVNQALPAPAPGNNNPALYVTDLLDGSLNALLDDLNFVLQAELFNEQPPTVQFATAIEQAQLTNTEAQAVGQYIAQDPNQAMADVMNWFNSQVQFAQTRPTYIVGNLGTNIALAAATGGTGEAGSFVSVASKLDQFAAEEALAAKQALASGNVLEEAADQLAGNVATQSAQQTSNIQILANYTKNLTTKLKTIINPANGSQNCVLCSAEGVYYFRGGQASVLPAPPTAGGFAKTYLEELFSAQFAAPTTLEAADGTLAATSSNADYGIVGFDAPAGSPPGTLGHAMNWLNLNGTIVYLDFQNGQLYTASTLSPLYANSATYTVNLTTTPFSLIR
jgi:Putative Ig domain